MDRRGVDIPATGLGPMGICEAYGIVQTRMCRGNQPGCVTPANKLASHVTARGSRIHCPSGVFWHAVSEVHHVHASSIHRRKRWPHGVNAWRARAHVAAMSDILNSSRETPPALPACQHATEVHTGELKQGA